MRNYLLGFLLILNLSAVDAYSDPSVFLSIDKQMELTLPAGWKAIKALKPETQIKAEDPEGYLFVQLVSENKEDFKDLKAYGKIAADLFAKGIDDAKVSGPTTIAVQGHPAYQYEIVGSSEGMNLGWIMTAVETKTRFNQVVGWGIRSRYTKGKEQLSRLAEGLRELP